MFISHFNDAVFIAKLINFAVFVAAIVWLFNKYGKPALVAHQEAQNRIVEDAKKYREQSEAAVAQARGAIDQAKTDSERMIGVGEAQAKRLIEVERAAATAHAARILAHASGELERERYRVRRELLEETVDRAHRKAQELAKRDIDATRQQALVEQAISYLERSHA